MKIVTTGAFGFSKDGFFQALREAGVQVFCDIRWRRAVRGSEYSFVNSERLQKSLAELGIQYLHFRELAPRPELRERQYAEDKAAGIAKRKRTVLGQAFIDGYRVENLKSFDAKAFIAQFGPEIQTVALFCVEREPAACHRSLLAERLHEELGVEVVHLCPGGVACGS